MAKEEKPKPFVPYESASGPIPLDHFGNDIEVTGKIDRKPGSFYDTTMKWFRDALGRKPEK